MFELCRIACGISSLVRFSPGLRLICESRDANWGFGNFDARDETVAATRDCFHKSRTLGGVPKRIPDFVDCFVESVVEIHEGVRRPEFFLKFLACYDVTVALKQNHQDFKRLFLKPDSQAMFPQLARLEIHFEDSKLERPARLTVFLHKEANPRVKGSVPPY